MTSGSDEHFTCEHRRSHLNVFASICRNMILVRSFFILSCLLLFIVPIIVISYTDNGCGRGRWKCGDVCISQSAQCKCGNSTIKFQAGRRLRIINSTPAMVDGTWCCAEPAACKGSQCLTFSKDTQSEQASCEEWTPGVCPMGAPISWGESCKGKCYSHLTRIPRHM